LFFCYSILAPPSIYPLSLHDALPISEEPPPSARRSPARDRPARRGGGRGSGGRAGGEPCHRPPRGARSARATAPPGKGRRSQARSEEHTSELQSLAYLVCRLLLEKKK